MIVSTNLNGVTWYTCTKKSSIPVSIGNNYILTTFPVQLCRAIPLETFTGTFDRLKVVYVIIL